MSKTIEELQKLTLEAQKAQRKRRNEDEAAVRAKDEDIKRKALEAELERLSPAKPQKAASAPSAPPAPSTTETNVPGGAK